MTRADPHPAPGTAPQPATPEPRLSVIIITKNESRHIGACLQSVAFADEVIVLDSGSSDDTCAIARQHGASVHVSADWPGFGPQKNRALDLASGDWVLSLDADERVTPELAQAVAAAMRQPAFDVYKMARLSEFEGRPIYHSGWWPDHVARLFKRGSARFTDALVHEKLESERPIGTLDAHLLHYPYENLEAVIAKMNRYSSDGATMMFQRGKRTTVLGAVAHGLWTFVRIYLVRRGFLDGSQGFVLACAAGAGSFFRYAKLVSLQRDARSGRGQSQGRG